LAEYFPLIRTYFLNGLNIQNFWTGKSNSSNSVPGAIIVYDIDEPVYGVRRESLYLK
jgi:hypothetical protein